jgi:glycosyltransferase involved in cell wall biosynthesis
MKIAQITPSYFPNMGGIETHVKEISKRLAHHHDVEVICADLSSSKNRTEIIDGVKITRFRSFTLRNTLYFSPGIYAYLKKNQYDVIHAHNYHALPAMLVSQAQPNNFVFSPYYHGKGSTPLTNILLKPYYYLGSRIFHRAKKIICVSEYEKNLIINDFHLSSDNISVIPTGIDLNLINRAQPFDSPKNLILSIGRLDRYKNIDLTMKVMCYLPDFNYYIIGKSGNYKKELADMIETLGLNERVKILDHVTDEEKYRWLKTCMLFVNLSDTESFGITVLEALAAGKSVIVNNSGGLREFVGKYKDEVIGIEKNQASGERFFIDLAKMIKERSGLEFKRDFLEYDWNTISQKIEQEYFAIVSD